MSSVFGMSEADLERRLTELIPQGRYLICYITSICILTFIFMNSRIFFPDFPLWVILGLLFMAGVMKKYASLEQNPQRHQAQAQAPPGTGLIGQTEQQVNVPTFVTRQQLPDIRIQLAELDREFDESDYDALRALDEDIAPNVSAMSEEDINALPVYKYQVQHHQHGQKVLDCTTVDGYKLKCSVCMDHVQEAELIRRLPCSHEVSPLARSFGRWLLHWQEVSDDDFSTGKMFWRHIDLNFSSLLKSSSTGFHDVLHYYVFDIYVEMLTWYDANYYKSI